MRNKKKEIGALAAVQKNASDGLSKDMCLVKGRKGDEKSNPFREAKKEE